MFYLKLFLDKCHSSHRFWKCECRSGFILSTLWWQGECSCITKAGSTHAGSEREGDAQCVLFSSCERMYFDISRENFHWLPSQSAIGSGPTFSCVFFLFFFRRRWEMGRGIWQSFGAFSGSVSGGGKWDYRIQERGEMGQWFAAWLIFYHQNLKGKHHNEPTSPGKVPLEKVVIDLIWALSFSSLSDVIVRVHSNRVLQ